MCLILEVDLPGVPRATAGALTKEAKRLGVLTLRAVRVPKGHEVCLFIIANTQQECSCAYLGDDSEEDGAVVKLDHVRLKTLRATLEFLADKAQGQLGLWVANLRGTRPEPRSQRVSWQELFKALEAGRLTNQTRYVVNTAAA